MAVPVLKLLGPDGRVIEVFHLTRSPMVVGRDHDVDIALADPSVSRRHAVLSQTPKGWLAVAEDATNGLRVGGALVREVYLEEGSVLVLGQTRLHFSHGDARSAPTVALPAQGEPRPAATVPGAPPVQGYGHAQYAPPAQQAHYAAHAHYARHAHAAAVFPGAVSGGARPKRRGCAALVIALLLLLGLVGAAAGGLYYYWDETGLAELLPATSSTGATGPPRTELAPLTLPPGGPGDGVGTTGPIFELDTTTAVFPLEVHGAPGARLDGKLVGAEGQRSIVFRASGSSKDEVVFPAAWNLPAVAVASPDGSVLVCGNALTGGRGALSAGAMPDPRGGVSLACRQRTGGAWGPLLTPVSGTDAHWLVDVVATSTGFEVEYSRDQSRFLVGQPSVGDGLYRVAFARGVFGRPELVQSLDVPFRRKE